MPTAAALPAIHERPPGARAEPSPEALERLVYLIGSPRGGTSVMQTSLGLHPELLALPELSHFIDQVWRHRNKVHKRLLRVIFQLPAYYDEGAVLRALPDGAARALRQDINDAFASKDLRRMWQLYPRLWALNPANPHDPVKARCWLDKANSVHHLEAIAKAFPQGRFLFVVRDPRSAIGSLARRSMRKATGSDDRALDAASLVGSAIYWRWMTQRALLFARAHPDRSLVFRYEDFLRSPGETLNGLYAHLGLTRLDPADLQARLATVPYIPTNRHAEGGSGISARPLERWRDDLLPEDAALIGALTARTAAKVGYDVPAQPRAAWSVAAALRRVPLGDRARLQAKLAAVSGLEPLVARPRSMLRLEDP